MREPALSAHLDVVFDHLASSALKRALPLLGCENAATKVRRMLLRIQAVLRDAEERQVEESAVTVWLRDLNCAVYDADDVFDELATRLSQLANECGAGIDSDEVSRSVSGELTRFDFPGKIGEIGVKFDEIARRSGELQLKELVGLGRAQGRERKRSGRFGGGAGESKVFGREVDKAKIVEMLVSQDSQRKDFDVIPVVGNGGVGKTTLSRLVFDDDSVVKHFKLRIWVSVSQDFDVRRLAKAIIESATGEKYVLLGMEPMLRHLRSVLAGKRYLLVLDDVRDEICGKWDMLQAPLTSGAKGSKIVATTASEMVSKDIGSASSYRLSGLSNENCWSLFSLHAFGIEDVDPNPDLVMIGKEIVKKCNGFPLAVKALGSLLHTWNEESRWRHILKNQIWKLPAHDIGLFPALWLSYYHLPLHLKQCFMYCSILPKNVKFGRDYLIRLWMAQGFIVPKESKRLEDLGGEYFEDLLWRSFLQYSHFDCDDDEAKYMIHEVLHDFSQFISGSECIFMHSDTPCNISKNARHLSVNSNKMETLSLDVLDESQGLRTFALVGESKIRELRVPENLFSKLQHLRVLDLNKTSVSALPESIGSLVHLRFLSLFGTQIACLPESLSSLFNLETLDLGDCFQLKELPKGMKNLINLRHLNLQLHQCRVPSLSSFPSGIGKLTGLETLSTFVVGSVGECQIEELKDLKNLRGKLCISRLDKIGSEIEAKNADLKNKHNIHKLELQWHLSSKVDGGSADKILESLQPHVYLKELIIRGYQGMAFPSWMGSPLFESLDSISLSDCIECDVLPPLGQLPSLKFLSLEKVGIEKIQKGFCGSGKAMSFQALKTLKFEHLVQWEEWSGLREGDMPCLQELYLIGCSQLRSLPCTLFALRKLEIWNCFGLASLPKLPSLLDLVLRCPTSTLLAGLHNQTSLQHLEIKNCPELVSLPRNLRNLLSLEVLVIQDCKQLNLLPEGLEDMASLEYLEISGCPQLHSFSDGFPSSLQFLCISNCPLLSQRCKNNGSEDWKKIAHLLSVCIDGDKLIAHDNLAAFSSENSM